MQERERIREDGRYMHREKERERERERAHMRIAMGVRENYSVSCNERERKLWEEGRKREKE